MIKFCSKCCDSKPRGEFHKRTRAKDGLSAYCKPCDLLMHQARHNRNPEARKQWNLNQYGITIEQKLAMEVAQSGLCKICQKLPDPNGPKMDRVLHVDHDHATGKVRGLLCGPCNKAIGLMHDNAETLRAAIAYLENP